MPISDKKLFNSSPIIVWWAKGKLVGNFWTDERSLNEANKWSGYITTNSIQRYRISNIENSTEIPKALWEINRSNKTYQHEWSSDLPIIFMIIFIYVF